MKKVALMTWVFYQNFGTSLQVTASVFVMRKMGYTVDVVDYLPHGKLISLNDYRSIKYYIAKIREKFTNMRFETNFDINRKMAFTNFIEKNIDFTQECKTDSNLFLLNEKYDAFVCGSDQIWSPSVFNEKYFLSFVENPRKMVAYAPSIGLSEINDLYVRKRMLENIDRFEHLSVREEQGAKLIKEMCNKEAQIVLDPTLLLTANDWDSMVIPKHITEAYILCYFLGTKRDNWSHVYEVSKRTGIKLKIIPVFEKDYRRGFDVIEGVGPGEFLSLIKDASMICTDSFHGTTFSIVYNKPFYVYERFSGKDTNNQNSRIHNILRLLGLENRLINNTKTISAEPLICCYAQANVQLEIERNKSKEYLANALNQATSNKSNYDYRITNTCCGCGVCSIICPKHAIEIKRNEKGFFEAFIDQEKCIRCEKCKTVCPFSNDESNDIDIDNHNLFMVKSLDQETLNTSSSGGAGYEIARILSLEGYDVVGCIYDKANQEAVHKIVKAGNIDSLSILKGSKYLQSNTIKSFQEISKNLNRAVIFGTPCQISGIDLLLKSKKIRENYVLIDLICHGVPSQNLWYKYLKEGAKLYEYGLFPEVNFREKSKGWREMFIQIKGNNHIYVKKDTEDLFYRFFLLGNCYMNSCYECNFRTSSSADIRIGDYWGPKYKDDNDGVSMVIIMTEVGERILDKLKKKKRIEIDRNECIEYWTVQYPENPIKPVFHDELLVDLLDENKSLRKIADFYCSEFEFRKKIVKHFSAVRSILAKGIRNNEQK